MATSNEWRMFLASELAARNERVDQYDRYYKGDHNLAFATSKFKEAFGDQLEAFATNWCGLVVDSAVDRMRVDGFKFPDDDKAGEVAWDIWQRNRMPSRSVMGHTEAVKLETAYITVGAPADDDEDAIPRITVEHPKQVITAHDPSDRSNVLAAYKRYTDPFGGVTEVVYEPNTITTWRRDSRIAAAEVAGLILPPSVGTSGAQTSEPNPLERVPVVPLENNPGLMDHGVSDLKPAVALNDAANKFFADMLVASEFGAFPQRVLLGIEIPDDEEEAQLKAALSRIWMFEDSEGKARVESFQPAELANYVTAIDTAVQHLAAQTRTPPHYLLAKLMNLSGDALKAAEAGLVHRVRRKFIDFGDGWEEAQRLGFAWQAWAFRQRGDDTAANKAEKRSESTNMETEWADPEAVQPGVVSDSLVKKKEIGWPQEMLWREGGMSPQEIEAAKRMLEESGSKLTMEQIQARREALIPFEVIWEEMGYSEEQIATIKEHSPLPADARRAAARNRRTQQQPPQPPNGNGGPQAQPAQPVPGSTS